MPTNYPITAGTLASSCYPSDPQTLNNEMMAKAFVTLNIEGVIVQQTTPNATDQDKIWFKLDAGDLPVGWFKYQGGQWVRPHDIAANDKRLYMFTGSSAEVNTLDGGTAIVVSDTTGPFWEIESLFETRMPIGVGTLPDSGTALSVGDQGGEEQHELTAAELPDLDVKWHGPDTNQTLGNDSYDPATGDQFSLMTQGAGIPRIGVSDGKVVSISQSLDGDKHQNLPLYRAVYFIQRTGRKFHVG